MSTPLTDLQRLGQEFDAPDPQSRLWSRTRRDGECIVWLGHTTNNYGSIVWNGKQSRVHRVAYEIAKGPIPEGLVIDHLCRNRLCVNPDHLEAVTSRTNILRGVGRAAKNAAKTHCKHGHPFDEANTMKVPRGRACRACRRATSARYMARIRRTV